MSDEARPVNAIEILVAEDSRFDRLFLQEAFDSLDVDVGLHFVDNGEEVLKYLRALPIKLPDGKLPSIIMLDLHMPRMNGNETVKALRQDALLCMLPVIVLSTSDHPGQIAKAYADGINAFMTKPNRFDDLVALMSRFATFWLQSARLPSLPTPDS
jgi:CheY-like chemotaxis protein